MTASKSLAVSPQELFVKGRELHKQGGKERLAEAEAAYAAALNALPAREATDGLDETPMLRADFEPDLLHLYGALTLQILLGSQDLDKEDEDEEDRSPAAGFAGNGSSSSSSSVNAIPEAALQRVCEAVGMLELAARLKPDDWRIWNSLGVARLRLAHCIGCPLADRQACLPCALTLRGDKEVLRLALYAYEKAIALDGTRWTSLDGARRVLHELDMGAPSDRSVEIINQLCKIWPDHPKMFYRLGILLHKLGRKPEAIAAFERHLENAKESKKGGANLKVAHAEHMVAMMSGITTATAPAEYVASLFDSYAKNFESHLVVSLQYHTPDALLKALQHEVIQSGPSSFGRAADLGAGTGLMGPLLKTLGPVSSLEAVDLSAKMLLEAIPKSCYHRLLAADLSAVFTQRRRAQPYLVVTPEQEELEDGVCADGEDRCDHGPQSDGDMFDLIVAADVFVYIGDLSSIFDLVRVWLRPHAGVFAFSLERSCFDIESDGPDIASDEQKGYSLAPTGRYTHKAAYIEDLARRYGFQIKSKECLVLRQNAGAPVHGYIFILRSDVV